MPLITAGITRDGFVLPANHSWDAKLINGKKEGKVTVKDEYGRITHVLLFVNDQLNGIAELYNHGELAEKRTYINNIEEGWSCEYERGREVRWFVYSNGVKKGKLKKSYRLYPHLPFHCYDNDYAQSFYSFVNKVILYEGEFYFNTRGGTGCSYKEGRLEYSGEWKNNLPDGNGWMTVKDKVYDGNWVKGRFYINQDQWFDYSSGRIEETPKERGSFLGQMVSYLADFLFYKTQPQFYLPMYIGNVMPCEAAIRIPNDVPLIKNTVEKDADETTINHDLNDVAVLPDNEIDPIFSQD